MPVRWLIPDSARRFANKHSKLSPVEAQHKLHSRPWTPESECGSGGSSPKRKKSDQAIKADSNSLAAARSTISTSPHAREPPACKTSRSPHDPQPLQQIQLPPLRAYLESHSLDVDLAAQSRLPPQRPQASEGRQVLPFRNYDTSYRSRQSRDVPTYNAYSSSSSSRPPLSDTGGRAQPNNFSATFRHGNARTSPSFSSPSQGLLAGARSTDLVVSTEVVGTAGVGHHTGISPSSTHNSQHARNFTWREPIYSSNQIISPRHDHPSSSSSSSEAMPAAAASSPPSLSPAAAAVATSNSTRLSTSASTAYFHITTPMNHYPSANLQPCPSSSSSSTSATALTTRLPTTHADFTSTSNSNYTTRNPKPRHNLPPAARATLKEWFVEHAAYPYPSEEEKVRLVQVTGLEGRQVENWFINARRRWKGRRAGD